MLLLCFCFSSALHESRLIFVFSFIYFFFCFNVNEQYEFKQSDFVQWNSGLLQKLCNTIFKPNQFSWISTFFSFHTISSSIFLRLIVIFLFMVFFFFRLNLFFSKTYVSRYVYVRKILWNVNKMMIMYILEQTNNL